MKIAKSKKTGLLAAMLTLCSLAVFLVLGIKQVEAITVTLDGFKFVDAAHIQGNVNGKQITFYDKDLTDPTHNYAPSAEDVLTLSQMGLCQGKIDNWGVNLKSKDLTASSIKGQVVLGEANGQGNNDCFSTVPSSAYLPSDTISITNSGSAATINYTWDGSGNIVGVTGSPTYQATKTYNVFIDQNNASSGPGACEASGLIIVNGTTSGALYIFQTLARGQSGDSLPNSIANYLTNPERCSIKSGPTKIAIGGKAPQIVSGGGQIKCNPNTDSNCNCLESDIGGQQFCTLTTPSGGTAVDQADDPCTVTGFSLSWLICPTLQAADKFSQVTINLFEKQLGFRISDLSRNGGQDKVKLSWSLIRDISSAVLVIIMLIMVISQAVGGGPFEAYTIRKMLPKLVLAVILIQLSWTLLSYVVGLFDDIGHGLKDILYLPFQGANLDDFGSLLGNAGVSTGTAAAFSWTAIIGLAVGVSIGLPALLGFVFAAIIADLTGLAVLIFRKIIIIMAMILAPLALLAWLLPGTQSYFKLWRENLLKALMMYPLVIGIVAAGRIFAYVIGTSRGDQFLNFFLVTVAFFGPLFILPKTYKWGGSALKSIGEQTFKVSEKYLTGKEAKPMKYFGARQEDWNNRRRARSQLRVAAGVGFEPKRLSSYWQTPLDRFRSNEWDPLLQGEKNASSKRSKVMQYKEAGHKVEEEEQNLSDREAAFEERRLNQSKYNHDHLWQDKADGELTNYGGVENVRLDELDDADRASHERYSDEYFSEWEKNNPGGTKDQFNARRRITYAERDFYQWKQANPGGTFEQFKKDKDAYGYKDYSGKIISVHKPEDKYARNAALNMLAKFGGPNHPMLVRYMYQELGAGGEREQTIREWMQDHSEFILRVYPQLLKGLTSTATAPSFVGMHQVGFRDELGRLMWNVNHPKTPQDRENAQRTLRQMVSNLVANMASNERNGIETDIRVLMKAIASGDTDTIQRRFNGEIEDMRYGKDANGNQILDTQTEQEHPPLIEVTDAVRVALQTGDQDLLARINTMIEPGDTGAYTPAATSGGIAATSERTTTGGQNEDNGEAGTAGTRQPEPSGPTGGAGTAAGTAGTGAQGPSGTVFDRGAQQSAPGGSSAGFNQLSDAIYENTYETRRLANAIRREQGQAETRQVPTEGGVLVVQQPAYQPNDVIRPVPGSNTGIVIPPGTRSLDNQPPGGATPPENPPGENNK
jgi:hypothetical protein